MTSQTSIAVLNQLNDLLKQFATKEYTEKLTILNGSSIGQHVRHSIELFQCLLDGVHSGIVNYDNRKRNHLIESNLDYTISLIGEIKDSILTIENTNISMLMQVSYGESNNELIETNFLRELVYMIEHTIHHFAFIRIGIQENFKHIAIEPNFGVAYSTIKHKEEILACN